MKCLDVGWEDIQEVGVRGEREGGGDEERVRERGREGEGERERERGTRRGR